MAEGIAFVHEWSCLDLFQALYLSRMSLLKCVALLPICCTFVCFFFVNLSKQILVSVFGSFPPAIHSAQEATFLN